MNRSSDPNVPLMESSSLVQPGRQFEFFETVEELAGFIEIPEQPTMNAGYADIYRGFWTNPQGERFQVAIKQLRTAVRKDRDTSQEELKRKTDIRLKREVFVWSRTTHPNLHPLLGYRLHPQPRLISPWCPQGNLDDYLGANPGLSRLDKLRLIFQTACGLEHLHSQTPPICHADIKPENVLMNDSSGPALSDFGLSRVVLDARSGFTTSETPKGTLKYMANELYAGQKPNLESDVYAFGGLILTVMSGKAPFDGLLYQVILRRVLLDEPPIPKDHPNLPSHDPLWKLMRRCWNTDPTARPTMRDVLLELLGQVTHEESNPLSGFYPPYVPNNGGSEHCEMDLDFPGALQHGGPLLPTDPFFVEYSPSGVPVANTEHKTIRGELLHTTGKTLKSVQLHSKVIPVLGKYIGAVAEVGLSLVEIVEATNKSENVSNCLELNPLKLAKFLQGFGEQLKQHRGGDIGAHVTNIRKELEFVQGKIKERDSSDFARNECSSFNYPSQKRYQGTIHKVLEEIQLLVTLDTASLMAEFGNAGIQEQNRGLLDRLGDGNYGAQGNAVEDAVCLPGTRVEILERVDKWIRDTSTPDRVFWIRGMAGRGKSTIASTVAHNWQSRASCAIFHFRRSQNALNARVICALARQLGSSLIPEVRNAVLESVQQNGDIADQRLSVQFATLFVVPLSKFIHHPHTILIVVDALDECQNVKDAVDFVKLIDQHSSSLPTNVKFLLTCRPESQLLRALEPRGWPVEDLDASVDVVDDLARFIKEGCTQIREDHGLSEDWPASSDIRSLVDMSQGLFQWARTVITYMGNGSPINRLRDLLKRPSTWNGLDELYHQILSKAFDNVRPDAAKQGILYSILGTLVVAPYPVSLDVIAALYGDNIIFEGLDQASVIEYLRQDILADLSSLLQIPTSPIESMHFVHTSIRDLLVNEQRCEERVYYIDVRQHHERLASLCLSILARCLKENTCNLSDLSKANSEVQDVIAREVSSAIRYCSRTWSIHLTEGAEWSKLVTEGPDGQRADFERFSKEKLLYWLEVMSLIGGTTEAIVIAKRVSSWLSRSNDRAAFDSESLATLWNDAQRFIVAFSEPISFGALHIYASALAHCPQNTQLWKRYGRHAKIRTLRGVQPLAWPAILWARDVGAEVSVIVFSPDGDTLASGLSDNTIGLWDAQTGAPLGQPLTGHTDIVLSVAFSPDGKVLASGSYDRTIRLWDTQSGTPLGQPLTGHNDSVDSVAFSPDGKVLASGSSDCTVRLWDAQRGTPVGQPLTGHNDRVWSVAFSPDGGVLASGSETGTVRLWDPQTGTPWGQPLIGRSDLARSVTFSPDFKVLAFESDDRTIRLWDARTRTPLGQPLTGHNDFIGSVAFSPDGKALASGSADFTIRLWDAQSGAPLGHPLTGHNCSVECLAFSPDGRALASGSWDNIIRLWDAHGGTTLGQPLTGHDDSVDSVAFSPDGKVLASRSSDLTIQLWDAQTGTPMGQPLIGHDDRVRSVAFSPDRGVLASGSDNGTVRLWDAQTGTPLGQPLTGHNHSVQSVAFSPDGKVLVSGSDDRTIRLWNARSGTPLGKPLTGHNDSVYSVVLSSDGKVLASGSSDRTVRLWDARSGTPLGQPLTGHHDAIDSIAFSPDGKVLASGSYDCTIRLWDAQSGMPLGQPLTGHNDSVDSVAFSPDGKVLASGSSDCTVRLWDAQSRTPLCQPRTGHFGSVYCVVFSPDGKVLASGSDDSTIRLWDAQSGTPLRQSRIDNDDSVLSVVFSPDGKVLASGSSDRTIRLWDAQIGTPLDHALSGYDGRFVWSVTFSPDGKVLSTGSSDRTLRLWDAQTGTPLGQPLTVNSRRVKSFAVSPDGKVLASGTEFGEIQLWDAPSGTPLGQPLKGFNRIPSFVSIPHADLQRPSGLRYCIPNIDDHWVKLSSSRLFWLPFQYWSDPEPTVLLSNETLAIVSNEELSIFDVSHAL